MITIGGKKRWLWRAGDQAAQAMIDWDAGPGACTKILVDVGDRS